MLTASVCCPPIAGVSAGPLPDVMPGAGWTASFRRRRGDRSRPIADACHRSQYWGMSARSVDLSFELQRNMRSALRDTSGSLMSNTKWRLVFETLSNPECAVRQLIVKFIDDPSETRMEVPWTEAPHAFLDSMSFGPFPIVSLEWVEVPAEAIFTLGKDIPAKRYAQNVGAVRAALEATGKLFPISETVAGLRITGHIR